MPLSIVDIMNFTNYFSVLSLKNIKAVSFLNETAFFILQQIFSLFQLLVSLVLALVLLSLLQVFLQLVQISKLFSVLFSRSFHVLFFLW